MTLKSLIPSRDEGRKLYVDKLLGTIIAASCAGVLALAFSPSRAWLTARVDDLLNWCGRGVTIPAWVLAVLAVACVSWLYPLRRVLRPADVRHFRSLSRDERQVMRLLARERFCLTEGSLCDLLPVPRQVFLHLIDRLVTDLQLAQRTEPEGGGAMWSLTATGRRVATANGLFARREALE